MTSPDYADHTVLKPKLTNTFRTSGQHNPAIHIS